MHEGNTRELTAKVQCLLPCCPTQARFYCDSNDACEADFTACGYCRGVCLLSSFRELALAMEGTAALLFRTIRLLHACCIRTLFSQVNVLKGCRRKLRKLPGCKQWRTQRTKQRLGALVRRGRPAASGCAYSSVSLLAVITWLPCIPHHTTLDDSVHRPDCGLIDTAQW